MDYLDLFKKEKKRKYSSPRSAETQLCHIAMPPVIAEMHAPEKRVVILSKSVAKWNDFDETGVKVKYEWTTLLSKSSLKTHPGKHYRNFHNGYIILLYWGCIWLKCKRKALRKGTQRAESIIKMPH